MLLLSRKPGEELKFTTPDGSQIVVTIVDIRGSVVRVGIEAPREVKVLRGELHEKVD